MKAFLHYFKDMQAFSGRALYGNLIGMMIVSFLDGMGILLLIFMLKASGLLPGAVSSSLWEKIGFSAALPQMPGLPFILTAYIGLTIAQNLLARSVAIRDIRLHQSYLNYLKATLYKNLLQAKWNYSMQTKKSNLVNSLTKDISRVGVGLKMSLQLITNLLFTAIQVGLAFYLAPAITLLVLLCGVCLALFSWRFVQQAKQLGNQTTQLSRVYLSGITENINALKDIKVHTLETSRMNWLDSVNSQMLQEQIGYVKLQTGSQLYYKTALACIIAVFVFSSVHLLKTAPEMLLFVIIVFSRLWPRFVDIQLNIQMIASSAPACALLRTLQQQAVEAADLYDETADPLSIKQMIECRNVSFRYQKQSPGFVLENINIHIPANKVTALVGKSGAGKSTLADLLLGLNHPESGSLLIDGLPLTDKNRPAFRKAVGYVSQDPFLFNTTIRENLMIMQPDADERELWNALAFAAADLFVKRLPDGLDTKIGDRGVRLSGGERQRLVLARAILRKPSLLVLDEATSSLDNQNEVQILDALEKIRGNMTIIVIAHRLSTIRYADQIIVLDQGKALQKGTFTELSNDQTNVFSQLLHAHQAETVPSP